MAHRSRRQHGDDYDDDNEEYTTKDRDEDHGRSKEVVKHREPKKSSRHYSEPEESDDEPKRKPKPRSDSRALVKSESKSKDKKKSSRKKEESESEEEEFVTTKRKRFEDVDMDDLDPEYLDALIGCLKVTEGKIEKWCHKGLIRLDTKEDCMNADKAVKKDADEDDAAEWARYEKRYKRAIKEEGGEMRRLGRGGEDTGASSSRPVRAVYAEPPRPIRGAAALFDAHRFNHRCSDCSWNDRFCGDPYHRLK